MVREDINQKEDEILSLYSQDYTIKNISKLMYCDFSVIKRILQKNNINIKPLNFYTKGKISKNRIIKNEQEVIDMYTNQNIPGTNIAKHFNCDNSIIYDLLKRNNVEIKGGKHFLKGRESPMKNKNYEELYGVEIARIRKEKVRLATIEVMKNPKHRKKLGLIRKDNYNQGILEKPFREKNPNWQGGLSFEPYSPEFNKAFKLAIKQRDGFMCLKCGMREEDAKILFKRGLVIHHIDYIKENTLKENCCVLCDRCHAETNSNRPHWTKFFQSLLAERYGYKYLETGEIILNIGK